MPQGSVLGPILFSIYLLPVIDLLEEQNIDHSFYADDGQLLFEIKGNSNDHIFQDITQVLIKIKEKFSQLKLMLNSSKTVALLIKGKRNQRDYPSFIQFDSQVLFSDKAKILGVQFDHNITFENHVQNTVKACLFHLRRLYAIRNYLSFELRRDHARTFVVQRLDYCNSLMANIQKKHICKLQRIFNSAVRFVFGLPYGTSTSGYAKDLHWLPVVERVNFKLACFAFKTLRGSLCPSYSEELILQHVYVDERKGVVKFRLPRTNTLSGNRAFSYAVPHVWNSLPSFVTSCSDYLTFRRYLKSFLFARSY